MITHPGTAPGEAGAENALPQAALLIWQVKQKRPRPALD